MRENNKFNKFTITGYLEDFFQSEDLCRETKTQCYSATDIIAGYVYVDTTH